MIMRITRGKLSPGTWSAFQEAYEATVVAKSVDIDGLRGRWLAQDVHDPEAGYAVSLWESLEEMRAYEQSAFYTQEILPALQPFFVGEFTTSSCAVQVTQEWPASQAAALSGTRPTRTYEAH
jgi:heme-degrading monooxygenase HmoA